MTLRAVAIDLDGALGDTRGLWRAWLDDARRRLHADGVRLGTFTDAPEELARVALGQLGAARRLDAVAAGANACERLLEQLGPDAEVVHDAADLARLAP